MNTKSHAHERENRAARGSANTAYKASQEAGVTKRLNWWVWIGGTEQRWVYWPEIKEQVDEAYRQWRARMALRGVTIMDIGERTDRDISQAINNRKNDPR